MMLTTKKASVSVMTNRMGINFSTDKDGQVDFSSVQIDIENEEDDRLDICDYCGEGLGFCASDCETLDPDFEE